MAPSIDTHARWSFYAPLIAATPTDFFVLLLERQKQKHKIKADTQMGDIDYHRQKNQKPIMHTLKEKVSERLSRLFADSPNSTPSSPPSPQVNFCFFFFCYGTWMVELHCNLCSWKNLDLVEFEKCDSLGWVWMWLDLQLNACDLMWRRIIWFCQPLLATNVIK